MTIAKKTPHTYDLRAKMAGQCQSPNNSWLSENTSQNKKSSNKNSTRWNGFQTRKGWVNRNRRPLLITTWPWTDKKKKWPILWLAYRLFLNGVAPLTFRARHLSVEEMRRNKWPVVDPQDKCQMFTWLRSLQTYPKTLMKKWFGLLKSRHIVKYPLREARFPKTNTMLQSRYHRTTAWGFWKTLCNKCIQIQIYRK